MALANTSKETPEREVSYLQTRSGYSSIYTCTYEHASSSSVLFPYECEYEQVHERNYEFVSILKLRVRASVRACTGSSEFELPQQCSS